MGLAGSMQQVRSWLPHEPAPVILMYHRIAAEPFDPWGLAVSPANFRDHLEWLAQNRMVLPLREFAELQRGGSLPCNSVAVTIDDGYACASEVAAPLLEQFAIPATIFVPVEIVASREPFWWDELEEMILDYEGQALTVDGDEFTLGPQNPADRRWTPGKAAATQRQSVFEQVHTRLARKSPSDLGNTMCWLRRQTGRRTPAAKRRLMTPEQMRRTSSSTVEFGSHSLTHPWLAKLDRAAKRHEICDSVDRLEKLSGSPPVAFAYPYGILDPVSEQLASEAGFECACAGRNAAVSSTSRPFALPRVHVRDCNAKALERLLTRALAA